jgi:hypothetical protein
MIFNFARFNRNKPEQAYVIIARYKVGDWFRRFVVPATSPYKACRTFDQSREFGEWIRVSNASLEN